MRGNMIKALSDEKIAKISIFNYFIPSLILYLREKLIKI